MKNLKVESPRQSGLLICLVYIAFATLLSACGGDQQASSPLLPMSATQSAEIATGAMTFRLSNSSPTQASDATMAKPSYHLAPFLLEPPDDTDVSNPNRSAHVQINQHSVPPALMGVSGKRLDVSLMDPVPRQRMTPPPVNTYDEKAQSLANTGVVSTYTPAQIRAAYSLFDMPVSVDGLSSLAAAQLGAGQTIYIIDAKHDPNLVAELSAFNQKFGLPACVTTTVTSDTSLPLNPASKTGCELSVVYSTVDGTMADLAPGYDSGWATEIALDVQWAHATAPLARIVLIEAQDSFADDLVGAINLANAMGSGVVSMSFGISENNTTSDLESAFDAEGMNYVAAAGDSGHGVDWPAVSPHVLAVGGTSLTYNGISPRNEIAWSKTGGGASRYTVAPAYQNNNVPGMGSPGHRMVSDVAFNADPATGQYVAVIKAGSARVSWLSAGGTSLATPQWAGILAIGNAMLAEYGKPAFGAPHDMFYSRISTVPGIYACAFLDVTKGINGACLNCEAKIGYDPLTGLGTPNVSNLLAVFTQAATNGRPIVTSANITGKAGAALTFTVSAFASDAMSYTLGNAPIGMSIDTSGIVRWDMPVAGTFTVDVTATDTVNGLSGTGTYVVNIAASASTGVVSNPTASGPIINAPAIHGIAGKPLVATVHISDPGTSFLSVDISGAPLGLKFSSNGSNILVKWPNPVPGSYRLSINVIDSSGLNAQATVPITITTR